MWKTRNAMDAASMKQCSTHRAGNCAQSCICATYVHTLTVVNPYPCRITADLPSRNELHSQSACIPSRPARLYHGGHRTSALLCTLCCTVIPSHVAPFTCVTSSRFSMPVPDLPLSSATRPCPSIGPRCTHRAIRPRSDESAAQLLRVSHVENVFALTSRV